MYEHDRQTHVKLTRFNKVTVEQVIQSLMKIIKTNIV